MGHPVYIYVRCSDISCVMKSGKLGRM